MEEKTYEILEIRQEPITTLMFQKQSYSDRQLSLLYSDVPNPSKTEINQFFDKAYSLKDFHTADLIVDKYKAIMNEQINLGSQYNKEMSKHDKFAVTEMFYRCLIKNIHPCEGYKRRIQMHLDKLETDFFTQ